MHRSSGVVIPLFSIRTRRDWGIGQITDLPVCAAWIRRAGQRLLQVLPPHELSVGETSPYGALTAFGLDPIYLDVEAVPDLDSRARAEVLGREGDAVLARLRVLARRLPRGSCAEDSHIARRVRSILRERVGAPRSARPKALSSSSRRRAYGHFDDLALYTALREARGGSSWTTWSEDQRERRPSAMQKVRADHGRRIVEVAYIQWLLSEQWNAAHEQMRDLGVELMGDIPFIVGTESADVWSHAAQFQLNVSLGAPPDDYSAEGQDWGLPAYDWLAMEADNLGWIRARARRAAPALRPLPSGSRRRILSPMGSVVRPARVAVASIGWSRTRNASSRPSCPRRDPSSDIRGSRFGRPTAGHRRGSRRDTPFVHDVLRRLEMPGYRVLPWQKDRSLFRDPRAFPASSVASWSTHDTAPIDAWWDEFPEDERLQLSARARIPAGASPEARSLALLGDLFQTSSDLTLVLAQELLGSRERINIPATVGSHNWTWRLPAPIEDLQADRRVDARLDAIRILVAASGRSSSR